MDHKDFIATLPRETIVRLSTVRDAPGLWHLAGHLSVIALLAVWIAQGWWLWPLALVGQGIAICFLFTLQHETTHKTPFETPWVNEWAGRLCGFLIVQPFEWFRYFHLAHHRHTNIPGKDPELTAGAKPETRLAFVWHLIGLSTWRALMVQVVRNAAGRTPENYVPARARPRIQREAQIMLIGYALVLLSLIWSPVVFWVWILPCLLGQPFLRLYLLAEHGRCAFVANMLENTRTTLTNRVVRFFAWNMPYHIEHHTMPQVPFHQLPQLHQHMQGHHGVLTDGYRRFSRDYVDGLQ